MILSYECDTCGKVVNVDDDINYEDCPKIIKNKLVVCRRCYETQE